MACPFFRRRKNLNIAETRCSQQQRNLKPSDQGRLLSTLSSINILVVYLDVLGA